MIIGEKVQNPGSIARPLALPNQRQCFLKFLYAIPEPLGGVVTLGNFKRAEHLKRIVGSISKPLLQALELYPRRLIRPEWVHQPHIIPGELEFQRELRVLQVAKVLS